MLLQNSLCAPVKSEISYRVCKGINTAKLPFDCTLWLNNLGSQTDVAWVDNIGCVTCCDRAIPCLYISPISFRKALNGPRRSLEPSSYRQADQYAMPVHLRGPTKNCRTLLCCQLLRMFRAGQTEPSSGSLGTQRPS
jgi:hypothetical protein